MKCLLTGFVPFLNHPINPTEQIVRQLQGQTINGYLIETAVLPVDFNGSAQQLVEEIDRVDPDVVIMLGLAAGRSKVTPERIAINVKDGAKDNAGYAPVDEEIVPGGADGLFTTLPIRRMVESLNANYLPAKISNSAGTYLCNNMMYVALHEASQRKIQYRAGFIHLPASHELAIENPSLPSWSLNDLTDAVVKCIEAL